MHASPITAGTNVVASAPAFADCVQPIKKSPKKVVEGSALIKPPIFVPSLSAAIVEISE